MVRRIVGSQPLEGKRVGNGSEVDGVWVDGALETFQLNGSIQPMGYRETQNDPNGQRTAQMRTLISRDQLRVSNLENPSLGDIVVFNGDNWRVWSLYEFDPGTVSTRLQHYQYKLIRIGVDV